MAQPDYDALAQGLTMAAQRFLHFPNIPALSIQNDLNQIQQQLQLNLIEVVLDIENWDVGETKKLSRGHCQALCKDVVVWLNHTNK